MQSTALAFIHVQHSCQNATETSVKDIHIHLHLLQL